MKLILLLLLAACAAPTSELIAEAKECVSTHINERGIIGKPSNEASKLCWAEVNKRAEAHARREEKKEKQPCPTTLVAWCDLRGCTCVSHYEARRALGY